MRLSATLVMMTAIVVSGSGMADAAAKVKEVKTITQTSATLVPLAPTTAGSGTAVWTNTVVTYKSVTISDTTVIKVTAKGLNVPDGGDLTVTANGAFLGHATVEGGNLNFRKDTGVPVLSNGELITLTPDANSNSVTLEGLFGVVKKTVK